MRARAVALKLDGASRRRYRARNAIIAAIVAAASTLFSGLASAQGSHPTPVVANGNAVVTGFSGMRLPAMVPAGVDPADRSFIDLEGPSARVIDLQAPGAPPRAQLAPAAKPFTVTAGQIGQVFGVALDNSSPPNIFVAATSVFGLPIVAPGAGGELNRLEQGAPNAAFMPGLFGPAQMSGGPGSIWRIDGTTGEVRLFANVALDGAPNPGPALGGIAFDPVTGTLFAADRATGLIHAFDMGGQELGRYDHGVQGRTSAGLPAVPYDATSRLDITSAAFQPGNPESWGYAAPARRIFGLGVSAGRLYYAVADGLQVWSVAIEAPFGSDPRLEVSVPPGSGPSEISKIAFDDQGRMLLAERAAPSGAKDFMVLTAEATGRVLRYQPIPGDASGARWAPVVDEYAIGTARQMRNGNGGIAIGFSYDPQGRIDRTSCGGFLWSTGEQLREGSDALLAQGGPTAVNGLQGNDIAAVLPANSPPLQSYFVDYDDQFQDPDARGHIGDVAILRICGLGGLEGPALFRPAGDLLPGIAWELAGHGGVRPPRLECPPGSGKRCACPPGKTEQPGFACCPMGFFPGANGQCRSPCPDGSTDPGRVEACWEGFNPNTIVPGDPSNWKCLDGSSPTKDNSGYHCHVFVMPVCPAGFEKDPASEHGCKPSSAKACTSDGQGFKQPGLDGSCQQLCPSGSWGFKATQCCPDGTIPGPDGKCRRRETGCPSGQLTASGRCCPLGTSPQPDGSCGREQTGCPAGTKADPNTGQCCSATLAVGAVAACACPPGQTLRNGKCVTGGLPVQPACWPGYVRLPSGSCCLASQVTAGGQCCPSGQRPDANGRRCMPLGGAPVFVPVPPRVFIPGASPPAPLFRPPHRRPHPKIVVPIGPPRIVVPPHRRTFRPFIPPRVFVPHPPVFTPGHPHVVPLRRHPFRPLFPRRPFIPE